MIIGISGGSGAGKSTTSRILSNIIPDSQLIVVDVLMHKYSFQYEDVILSVNKHLLGTKLYLFFDK